MSRDMPKPPTPGRSLSKDFRELVRQLQREGWGFRPTARRGHAQLVPPWGGRPIPLCSTPGSRNSLTELRADIRRAQRLAATKPARKNGARL